MEIARKLFCYSILSIIILISGCIDSPSPVGSTSLPYSDYSTGRVDTFYATGHSSLYTQLYTLTIDRFMIGKYLSYEAWSCLRFYQFPDTLIGATVKSASIQLRRFYSFGDSTSAVTFDIYDATANIFNDSLTVDSLNSYGNLYYNSTPINGSMNLIGDTLYNVDIDTSVVRRWLGLYGDTSNYGIVFRPTNSNSIKGFYSIFGPDTSYVPALVINYEDTSGNTGTYIHKFSISRYVSVFDSLSLDGNFINVQDGISMRGIISFDNLLNKWPVQIHRAVLQITLDSANSSIGFNPRTPFANNSLYCLSVDESGQSDGASFNISKQTTDALGRRVYSFEIRPIAERWLSYTAARKVAIAGFYEVGSFDLFAFFGEGSANALKPRVIITYSIQN